LSHGEVVLVELKLDVNDQLASFSTLTLLVGSSDLKTVSKMTFKVLSGTLIFCSLAH